MIGSAVTLCTGWVTTRGGGGGLAGSWGGGEHGGGEGGLWGGGASGATSGAGAIGGGDSSSRASSPSSPSSRSVSSESSLSNWPAGGAGELGLSAAQALAGRRPFLGAPAAHPRRAAVVIRANQQRRMASKLPVHEPASEAVASKAPQRPAPQPSSAMQPQQSELVRDGVWGARRSRQRGWVLLSSCSTLPACRLIAHMQGHAIQALGSSVKAGA